MDGTMVEVLSFVLSIAGLLATVVLGFTLHFLGVRTRGRQKKEVSSANLRGKSLALNGDDNEVKPSSIMGLEMMPLSLLGNGVTRSGS